MFRTQEYLWQRQLDLRVEPLEKALSGIDEALKSLLNLLSIDWYEIMNFHEEFDSLYRPALFICEHYMQKTLVELFDAKEDFDKYYELDNRIELLAALAEFARIGNLDKCAIKTITLLEFYNLTEPSITIYNGLGMLHPFKLEDRGPSNTCGLLEILTQWRLKLIDIKFLKEPASANIPN